LIIARVVIKRKYGTIKGIGLTIEIRLVFWWIKRSNMED